jgi:hypothetical protein
MTKLMIVFVTALLMAVTVVARAAGTPYGPPGWNTAPDPCRNCQIPPKTQLPDNRQPKTVTPPPPPNPNHDPDVQHGIDSYKRPGS